MSVSQDLPQPESFVFLVAHSQLNSRKEDCKGWTTDLLKLQATHTEQNGQLKKPQWCLQVTLGAHTGTGMLASYVLPQLQGATTNLITIVCTCRRSDHIPYVSFIFSVPRIPT